MTEESLKDKEEAKAKIAAQIAQENEKSVGKKKHIVPKVFACIGAYILTYQLGLIGYSAIVHKDPFYIHSTIINSLLGRDAELISFDPDSVSLDKPVLYIYNATDNPDLAISVEVNNSMPDITYPRLSLDNYWHVSADANSNIVVDNREYNYLYWETQSDAAFSILEGYCIKGEDTVAFLESALSDLGLTDREQDDFITYWLPRMRNNKYNIIQFNPTEYFNSCKHIFDREPDNEIYAYMLFEPSDEFVELEAQDLSAMNNKTREGLTIVEWGGTELTGGNTNE